eukprot:TRINITY_DN2125_c0_g3_i1.p1 TRINITY_DN2125_c0_g3~~TRINITY_DN2125_c0_g3_i1.p1  ORF type:complete len:1765 (+),score=453.10 TRINITY_DN2125_c0_g3_i1:79-5373(+)
MADGMQGFVFPTEPSWIAGAEGSPAAGKETPTGPRAAEEASTAGAGVLLLAQEAPPVPLGLAPSAAHLAPQGVLRKGASKLAGASRLSGSTRRGQGKSASLAGSTGPAKVAAIELTPPPSPTKRGSWGGIPKVASTLYTGEQPTFASPSAGSARRGSALVSPSAGHNPSPGALRKRLSIAVAAKHVSGFFGNESGQKGRRRSSATSSPWGSRRGSLVSPQGGPRPRLRFHHVVMLYMHARRTQKREQALCDQGLDPWPWYRSKDRGVWYTQGSMSPSRKNSEKGAAQEDEDAEEEEEEEKDSDEEAEKKSQKEKKRPAAPSPPRSSHSNAKGSWLGTLRTAPVRKSPRDLHKELLPGSDTIPTKGRKIALRPPRWRLLAILHRINRIACLELTAGWLKVSIKGAIALHRFVRVLRKRVTDRRYEELKRDYEQVIAEQGLVTEVPDSDDEGDKRPKAHYRRQADPAMNEPEALRARIALRDHQEIQEAIEHMWDRLPRPPAPHKDKIDKQVYQWLAVRISAIFAKTKQDKQQALAHIDEDWIAESNGEYFMDYDAFFDAIFSLLDVWVTTVDAEDYMEMMHKVQAKVASVVDFTWSMRIAERQWEEWLRRIGHWDEGWWTPPEKRRVPTRLSPENFPWKKPKSFVSLANQQQTVWSALAPAGSTTPPGRDTTPPPSAPTLSLQTPVRPARAASISPLAPMALSPSPQVAPRPSVAAVPFRLGKRSTLRRASALASATRRASAAQPEQGALGVTPTRHRRTSRMYFGGGADDSDSDEAEAGRTAEGVASTTGSPASPTEAPPQILRVEVTSRAVQPAAPSPQPWRAARHSDIQPGVAGKHRARSPGGDWLPGIVRAANADGTYVMRVQDGASVVDGQEGAYWPRVPVSDIRVAAEPEPLSPGALSSPRRKSQVSALSSAGAAQPPPPQPRPAPAAPAPYRQPPAAPPLAPPPAQLPLFPPAPQGPVRRPSTAPQGRRPSTAVPPGFAVSLPSPQPGVCTDAAAAEALACSWAEALGRYPRLAAAVRAAPTEIRDNYRTAWGDGALPAAALARLSAQGVFAVRISPEVSSGRAIGDGWEVCDAAGRWRAASVTGYSRERGTYGVDVPGPKGAIARWDRVPPEALRRPERPPLTVEEARSILLQPEAAEGRDGRGQWWPVTLTGSESPAAGPPVFRCDVADGQGTKWDRVQLADLRRAVPPAPLGMAEGVEQEARDADGSWWPAVVVGEWQPGKGVFSEVAVSVAGSRQLWTAVPRACLRPKPAPAKPAPSPHGRPRHSATPSVLASLMQKRRSAVESPGAAWGPAAGEVGPQRRPSRRQRASLRRLSVQAAAAVRLGRGSLMCFDTGVTKVLSPTRSGRGGWFGGPASPRRSAAAPPDGAAPAAEPANAPAGRRCKDAEDWIWSDHYRRARDPPALSVRGGGSELLQLHVEPGVEGWLGDGSDAEAAAAGIAAAPGPEITALVLRGVGMGDGCLRVIGAAAATHLPSLELLDIRDNPGLSADAVVPVLTLLQVLPRLKLVRCAGSPLQKHPRARRLLAEAAACNVARQLRLPEHVACLRECAPKPTLTASEERRRAWARRRGADLDEIRGVPLGECCRALSRLASSGQQECGAAQEPLAAWLGLSLSALARRSVRRLRLGPNNAAAAADSRDTTADDAENAAFDFSVTAPSPRQGAPWTGDFLRVAGAVSAEFEQACGGAAGAVALATELPAEEALGLRSSWAAEGAAAACTALSVAPTDPVSFGDALCILAFAAGWRERGGCTPMP